MKKLIAILSAIILVVSTSLVSISAFSAKVHGDYVHKVLFGLDSYQLIVDEYNTDIEILDAALTLCIDQFNGTDRNLLTTLNSEKVRRIPSSISDIDLTEVSSKTHRLYTHQGWEKQESYLAETGRKDFINKWQDRKNILLSTVNHLFDFGLFAEMGTYLFGIYNEKCDSFAATIYYVHILSDYLEAENYKATLETMMPIAVRASSGDSDIINEMIEHFKILFSDQLENPNYASLIDEMNTIHRNILKVSKSNGYPFDDDSYNEYHKQVEYLVNALIEYVPKLLEKEKFFAKKFNLA